MNLVSINELAEGATKAHLAVENNDISVIQLIEPSSILVQDNDGETPLHYAATNGNVEICKILVEKNPKILTIKDVDNKTAYDWALAYNAEYNGSHKDVCDFLANYY
jgi:ankyrin repeat protein